MSNVRVVKLLKYVRPHQGLIKAPDVVPSAMAGKVGGKATAYEKDSIMKEAIEETLDKLEKMIERLEMEEV